MNFKKGKLVAGVVVFLVLLLQISNVFAANDLMYQGDAEGDLQWWATWTSNGSVTDIRIVSDEAYSGTKSFFIKNTISDVYSTHYVTIGQFEPSKQYTLSYWIKTEDVDPSMNGKGARIGLLFTGIAGESLEPFIAPVLTGTNDWTYVEEEFKVPEGEIDTAVNLALDGASGKVWFDEVKILYESEETTGSEEQSNFDDNDSYKESVLGDSTSQDESNIKETTVESDDTEKKGSSVSRNVLIAFAIVVFITIVLLVVRKATAIAK